MKTRIQLFFLAMAVAVAPSAVQAQLVWDTSTAAGFQNGNGTWGTDNFWTTTGGGGTTLTGWTSGQNAWFGGNSTVAATPGGNFTVTVDGTQTVGNLRQIQNGDGNYTWTGGTLALGDAGVRVDQGTMTVNSTIADSAGSTLKHLNVQSGTLILGGNNTFSSTPQIRGVGFAGTIRLTNAGALGTGTTVQFVNGAVTLDLNALDISGKTITVNNGQTGFLDNTAATKSVWSGDVDLSVGTGTLRAGGTGAEVEISGIISGNNGLQSMDNGILRLTGNNTHNGNSLRAGSTLIVGNANALGDASFTTFIGSSTLDLNGFDIGSRTIRFQQNNSRMVNDNTLTAALHSGTIEMQDNRNNSQVGGDGNLTLSGDITVTNTGTGGGFTKVGTGTLTLSGSNTYTGQTTVNAGSLLVNGDQSAATGAVTVASLATLGGTGTLGGATAISGILAPGDGGIGTLTVANDVTWNGGESWLFELGTAGASIGSPGTSDLLSITGSNDFLKGTGSSWTFDFAGTGDLGWYKLADWTDTTDFQATDFTAANLGGGNTGEFTISENALYIQVVPEPGTWALAVAGLAGAAWGRGMRRRRAA